MITMKRTGDWKRAGVIMSVAQKNLDPMIKSTLKECGEMVLSKMKEHIDSQDLGWQPLASSTVKIKGSDQIYVESGTLYNSLSVRFIKSAGDTVIFVGASPWKTHKNSGLNLNTLMGYLEYGTNKMPARPLIRPTWDEMQPIVVAKWNEAISELFKG